MVQKKSFLKRGLKGGRKISGKKPKSFEQRGGLDFAGADEAAKGEVLQGRIIGLLDDGFVLRGEKSVEDIFCGEEVGPTLAGSGSGNTKGDVGAGVAALGDIVEVHGARAPVRLADGGTVIRLCASAVMVLQKCEADFFVRPSDPNWLRGVVDRSVGESLRARALAMKAVREFFEQEDFLEVDTPSLVRLPGMEPYLDVFKTRFFAEKGGGSKVVDGRENMVKKKEGFVEHGRNGNYDGMSGEDMYLITSPEYAMKKLLVSGERKIFQLAKVFRNRESGSGLHNPEFTLLEWYRAYSDYSKIMDDTERLVRFVHEKVSGAKGNSERDAGRKEFENGRIQSKGLTMAKPLLYKGKKVDMGGPWPRKKVTELFEEYAGVPVEVMEDEAKLRAAAEAKGYAVNSLKTYNDLFFAIFLNEIEPNLGFDQPVFVYEYPVSMAALARQCPHNPRYAERFELYIAGVEMCNGFGELRDAAEQKRRLERERLERKNLKKEDYGVDQTFLRALEFGMPPSGGNALGIDRLIMLLFNAPDIQSVMAFPHKDL